MVWLYEDCAKWKTTVHFLLIINLGLRDVACVNTLWYVVRHAA